jgi:hypothetical protein
MMLIKKLPYSFYDATVIKCLVKKGTILKLKIQLHKILNPNQEIITLTFYGVKETQKIFDLSRGLHQLSQDQDWNGNVVKNIAYDSIKESKEGELYFYLDFEGIKSERISCESLKIEVQEQA